MNENSQCISKSECIELGEPAVREKVQQGQRKSHSAEAVLLNSFFFVILNRDHLVSLFRDYFLTMLARSVLDFR